MGLRNLLPARSLEARGQTHPIARDAVVQALMVDHVKKPAGPLKTCPICGKPQAQATLPFCSSRCRDVDLNRWLKGSYVIPGRDDEADGEE